MRRLSLFATVLALALVWSGLLAEESPQDTAGLSTIFQLMGDSEFRKELSMTNEQAAELSKLFNERRAAVKAFAADSELGTDEERRNRANTMTAHLREIEAKVAKVLLPHQSTRLRQILVQVRSSREASSFGLLNPPLAEKLGLTDQQRANLAEKTAEIERRLRIREAEMLEELKELRRKSQD